jgi:hypothetical protein
VSGNVIRFNTGYGIETTGSGSTYDYNTVNSNTAGTINGSLINMGGNSCNATNTCP